MKIWAHRGCSQRYPENTILSFEKAAAIRGLTGIELDIQLTKDGNMVVCHDEKVDRTTDGSGELRGYTLAELKKLRIDAGNGKYEQIPTIEEVLDLLENRMKDGLKFNIELKNSVFPYEGMEQKIMELVYKRGLQDNVIYSSFSALSLERIREMDGDAEIGILDRKISDCLSTECAFAEWYVDREGEFRSRQLHHDGTDNIYYRKFKESADYDDRAELMDQIYRGVAKQEDIDRLTEKLGEQIGAVYGWEFPTHKEEQVKAR